MSELDAARKQVRIWKALFFVTLVTCGLVLAALWASTATLEARIDGLEVEVRKSLARSHPEAGTLATAEHGILACEEMIGACEVILDDLKGRLEVFGAGSAAPSPPEEP